ncbi:MAG TPA: DMT family transporter [Ignavibacteria bacterium]|nr:DMT family transporter [Ignavibacteria bacterium]
MIKIKTETLSILYALGAVLLWSTVATAFKLTLEGLNYAQLLFYSSVTSTAVLLIFAFRESKKEVLNIFKGNEIFKNIILGLFNPFLYYLVLFQAYSLLPAQEAQPLNYTWPIMISVFSVIFLGQKLSLRTIIGLVSAFFGVIVIATRGDLFGLSFHNLFGVILAVGSSLIWAGFWTMSLIDKRKNSIKLFASFLFGSFFTFFFVLLFDSFHISSIGYLFGAVYIGLFEMGITFFLWMKGLQLSINKAKTSTLAYLSPFISLIFIALILGEIIRLSSIIGLVFIIGGILYQQLEGIKFRKFVK